MKSDMNLDRALAYARRGFHIFPVHTVVDAVCTCGDPDCAHPGKHPMGALAPHGRNDATTEETKITEWWTAAPHANIGAATWDSGFFTVDVDVRHGGLST